MKLESIKPSHGRFSSLCYVLTDFVIEYSFVSAYGNASSIDEVEALRSCVLPIEIHEDGEAEKSILSMLVGKFHKALVAWHNEVTEVIVPYVPVYPVYRLESEYLSEDIDGYDFGGGKRWISTDFLSDFLHHIQQVVNYTKNVGNQVLIVILPLDGHIRVCEG